MDASVPGYVLHEALGHGTGSTVHRAEELASGRTVVVKRVTTRDPGRLGALRAEVATLRRLDHPNVLAVLDVIETDDGLALVLPLAADTVSRRLAAQGALPPEDVAEVGAAVAAGLAAAHDAGVVHRDVKPSNLLIDTEGVPVLADFGAASSDGGRDREVVGTAEYLDPAVVVDGAAPDARSDIYALGVTLYELLTGVPPYAGSTPQATIRAADRGVHVPLRQAVSHAPPRLTAAVERAMARDPDRRHASARDLARDLEAARLDAATSPATPGHPAPVGERSGGTRHFGPRPTPPPTETGHEGRGRRRWLLAALAAVIVVPVSALVLVPRFATGSDPAPSSSPVSAGDRAPTPVAPPPACPDEVEPSPRPDTTVLVGDLTGEGCATYVLWSDGVLEVPRGAGEPADRYRMGEAGDVPVLGDWDCDDRATPGVYRPSTGEVFLFDGFAGADGELTSRPGYPSGRRDGVPVVADVDDDGCHEVVITPRGV